MKTQSLVCVLVATNLMLGVGVFVQSRSVEAQGRPVVLRAQKIELVDASGQVRASLEVAGNREAVLRLRDSSGNIRVKIGGSGEGSGLVLYDDSTEPGVHILAKQSGGSVAVIGKDGQRRVIQP